jgi:hypothetical protein
MLDSVSTVWALRKKDRMKPRDLARWPETFATSFLRCPKCGKGRLKCRKTEVITETAHKTQYECQKCQIVILAVSMMAKSMR